MKIGMVVINAVLACALLVAVTFVVFSDPLNLNLYPRLLNLLPVALIALISVSNAIMFVRTKKEMDNDLTYLTKWIAKLEEELNVLRTEITIKESKD